MLSNRDPASAHPENPPRPLDLYMQLCKLYKPALSPSLHFHNGIVYIENDQMAFHLDYAPLAEAVALDHLLTLIPGLSFTRASENAPYKVFLLNTETSDVRLLSAVCRLLILATDPSAGTRGVHPHNQEGGPKQEQVPR